MFDEPGRAINEIQGRADLRSDFFNFSSWRSIRYAKAQISSADEGCHLRVAAAKRTGAAKPIDEFSPHDTTLHSRDERFLVRDSCEHAWRGACVALDVELRRRPCGLLHALDVAAAAAATFCCGISIRRRW